MKIKIGNKEYIGQCNALSYVFYRRIFKTNIFDDINILREELNKIVCELSNDNGVNFYNILIKLVYTLIYTYNQEFIDFEEWKEEIAKQIILEDTINKVIDIYLESFINEEVKKQLEKLPKSNENEEVSLFPEHDFLCICLKINLNIQDLKFLTYVDVVKIFLSNCSVKKDSRYRNATQADWDRLALS